MSESPSTLAHADQPHVAPEQLPAIETDALIIGAGPVGLFQVFQLGLLEVGCHVVDALPYVGGQPAELYPDKPIYDLPGVPVATGRELTSALLRQIEPFKPQVHMGQTVQSLERQPDGRFLVRTSRKVRFLVRAVLIAAGVGAFEPRTLTVPGLSDWESRQVFYRVADMPETSGREILVVGGGEEAIDAIGDLLQDPTRAPAGITLMHRRDHFQAPSDALEQLTQWRETGRVRFLAGQVQDLIADGDRLKGASYLAPDGSSQHCAFDDLLIRQGLQPKLGPLTKWGLSMERKQLVVDTEKFETSETGVFAVGDINTYPGKKKLLVSGFHESALAAYAVAALIRPDRPVQLQYTTTSTRLHQLLGVDHPTRS